MPSRSGSSGASGCATACRSSPRAPLSRARRSCARCSPLTLRRRGWSTPSRPRRPRAARPRTRAPLTSSGRPSAARACWGSTAAAWPIVRPRSRDLEPSAEPPLPRAALLAAALAHVLVADGVRVRACACRARPPLRAVLHPRLCLRRGGAQCVSAAAWCGRDEGGLIWDLGQVEHVRYWLLVLVHVVRVDVPKSLRRSSIPDASRIRTQAR